MKQSDAVADHRRATDHDPRPVVNGERATDDRLRMNFNAGRRMGDVRDHSRDERRSKSIEDMGEPIVNDRSDRRIAPQNFVDGSRGVLTVENRLHVGFERSADSGKQTAEVGNDFRRKRRRAGRDGLGVN